MAPPNVSKRIRVAFVITELEVGGAERCLVRVATGLDQTEFDPLVISLASPPRENGELVEQLRQAQVPVQFLQANSVRQLLSTWWRLRATLRTFAPDVVQAFLFHANTLSTFAAPRNCPVVLGVRVADPSRWRLSVERHAARHAKRIVCVSDSVRDFVVQRAGFEPDKTLVIPNCVDVDKFCHARPADLSRLGIGPDRHVLLFIGRLEHQKGLDWFMEMGEEILTRLPEHDLLLVGAGSLRARIESWSQSLPPSRVHVLGWQADVPGLLNRAEMLVLPSRWEGMPNVVLEAMAAGIPVVSSDVEGVAEALGDDASPQTANFGDSPAFIERIVAIARNAELRGRLAENNQRRARQLFSTGQMVGRYAEIYRTLAK